MKNANIYARSSRTSSYHETSIARQEELCKEYLIKNNYKPIGLYGDVAISSEMPLKYRPQFQALLATLNKNEENIIIIEEISRLLRTKEIAIEFKEIIKEYKIVLISTNNPKIMSYFENITLLEPLLEHLYHQKLTLLAKFKTMDKIAKEQTKRRTLDNKPKINGRKNWLEKDPRVLGIIEENRNLTIKEIQKKLLENKIVSATGKVINTNSIWKYRNIVRERIGKREYSTSPTNIQDPLKIARMVYTVGELENQIIFCLSEKKWYQYSKDSGNWRILPLQNLLLLIHSIITEKFPEKGYEVKTKLTLGFLKEIAIFLEIIEKLTIIEWPRVPSSFLPLKDKLLNITTGELIGKTPDQYLRWGIEIESKEIIKAKKEDFYKTETYTWLKEITKNNYEKIYIILAYIKLCLTRTTKYQKYLELIGPGGTGKSTLIKLITAIVGKENTVSTELKQLEQNRFETANLFNKSLITISDSSRYTGDCSILKAIVGEDLIRFEEKHKQSKESFKIEGLVIIAANEEIRTSDYSTGLARRRLTLYFNHRPNKPKVLISDSYKGWEGPLIKELPILIKYLISFKEEGINLALTSPERFLPTLSTDKYIMEKNINPILGFILDRCSLNPTHYMLMGTKDHSLSLYSSYFHYCISQSICPVSSSRFSNLFWDLTQNQLHLPITKGRCSQGVYVQGLSIISSDFNWIYYYSSISNMPHSFVLSPGLFHSTDISSFAGYTLYNSLAQVEDKILNYDPILLPSFNLQHFMNKNLLGETPIPLLLLKIKNYDVLSSLDAKFNLGEVSSNATILSKSLDMVEVDLPFLYPNLLDWRNLMKLREALVNKYAENSMPDKKIGS